MKLLLIICMVMYATGDITSLHSYIDRPLLVLMIWDCKWRGIFLPSSKLPVHFEGRDVGNGGANYYQGGALGFYSNQRFRTAPPSACFLTRSVFFERSGLCAGRCTGLATPLQQRYVDLSDISVNSDLWGESPFQVWLFYCIPSAAHPLRLLFDPFSAGIKNP